MRPKREHFPRARPYYDRNLKEPLDNTEEENREGRAKDDIFLGFLFVRQLLGCSFLCTKQVELQSFPKFVFLFKGFTALKWGRQATL